MLRSVWKAAFLNRMCSPSSRPTFFHSTPAACAKWKNKFSYNGEGNGQRPSKNYVRYAVRQKRADAKRALKELLNGKYSNSQFQDEDLSWHAEGRCGNNEEVDSADFEGQAQTKTFGKSKSYHSSGKHKQKRRNRKKNKQSFYSDDDHLNPDTTFQATFGNKCYTWSFRPWNDVHSTPGFEWRDGSKHSGNSRVWGSSGSDDDSRWRHRTRTWERESDFEDDSGDDFSNVKTRFKRNKNGENICARTIGSYSHRVTLGLPPTGPLNIDDVKNAFRVSALKWHPDKHQGPSQAVAEEKFKLCLDAYTHLCDALNTA